MDFYKDMFKPILIDWKTGERRSVKSFVQDFISQKVLSLQPKTEETMRIEGLVNEE